MSASTDSLKDRNRDGIDTCFHIATDSPVCRRTDIGKHASTIKAATESQYGGPVESSANLNKLSVTEELSKTTDVHESAKADVPYHRRSISSLINDLPQSRGALKRFYEENVEDRSPSLIPWRTFSFPDLCTDENSSMLSTGGDPQKGIIKSATCDENLGKCGTIRSSSSQQSLAKQKSQKAGNVRFHNFYRNESLPRRLIQSYRVRDTDEFVKANDTCVAITQPSELLNEVGGKVEVCNQRHVKDYTSIEVVDTRREQEVITSSKSGGTGKSSSKLPRHISPLPHSAHHGNTDRGTSSSNVDYKHTETGRLSTGDKLTGTGRSNTDEQHSVPQGDDDQAASAVNVQTGVSTSVWRPGVTTSNTRPLASANEACTVTTVPNSGDNFRLIENNGKPLCGELKGVLSGVRGEDTRAASIVLSCTQQENTGNSVKIGENSTSVFPRRSRIDRGVTGRTRASNEVTPLIEVNNRDTSVKDISCDLPTTESSGVQTAIILPTSIKSLNLLEKEKESRKSSTTRRAVFNLPGKRKYSYVLTSEEQTGNVRTRDSGSISGECTGDQTTCDGIISSDDLVRPCEAISSGIDNNEEHETDVNQAVLRSNPSDSQQGELGAGLLPDKSTDDYHTIPGQTTAELTRDPLHDVTRVKMNNKSLSKYSSLKTKHTSGGNEHTAIHSTVLQGKTEPFASKTLSKRTKLPTSAVIAKTNSAVAQVKSDSNSSASSQQTKHQVAIKATKRVGNVIPNPEPGVQVKLRSGVGKDTGKISRDEKRIPIRRNDKLAHPDYAKRCKTFVNEQESVRTAVVNSGTTRANVSSRHSITVVSDKNISPTTSNRAGNLSSIVPADVKKSEVGNVTENNTKFLSGDKDENKTPQITTGGVITTGNQISDISQRKGIRVEKSCTPAKKISSADNKSSLETSSTFNEITQPADRFGRVETKSISQELDIPLGSLEYCFSDGTNLSVTENTSDEGSSLLSHQTDGIPNVCLGAAVLSGGGEVCTGQLPGINAPTTGINLVTDTDEVERNEDVSVSCKYNTYCVTKYQNNDIGSHVSSNAELLQHSVQYEGTDQSVGYRQEFILTRDVENDVLHKPTVGIDKLKRDGGFLGDMSHHPNVAGCQHICDCDKTINSGQVCNERTTDDTRVNTTVSDTHVMSENNGCGGESRTCKTDTGDNADESILEDEAPMTSNVITNDDESRIEKHDPTTGLNNVPIKNRSDKNTSDHDSMYHSGTNVTDDVTDQRCDNHSNDQDPMTWNTVTDDETDLCADDQSESQAPMSDGVKGVMNSCDGANRSDSDINGMTGDYVPSVHSYDTEVVPRGTVSTLNTERDKNTDNVTGTVYKPSDEDKLDHGIQGMLQCTPISRGSNPEKSRTTELSVKQEFKTSGTGLMRLNSKDDKRSGSGNAEHVSKCKQGANNKTFFSKSRSLSPQTCPRQNAEMSDESCLIEKVQGNTSVTNVKTIKKPRTSTPINSRRSAGKQNLTNPQSNDIKRSKNLSGITPSASGKYPKRSTKLQSTSKITRESSGGQKSNSVDVCIMDKHTSELSKESSISRESSPSLSVSSDGQRSKSSRDSVSSINGPSRKSVIGKEKKENLNLVNRRTNYSDINTTSDNPTHNVRHQTDRSKHRLKSPEVNESSRIKGHGTSLQARKYSSNGQTITKDKDREASSGLGNVTLRTGKGEATTVAKLGSVTSLKETSKTSIGVKTDTVPIKKSKVMGYEKSTKSKDNKVFQVSNTKSDLDKPMDPLSSAVLNERRASVSSLTTNSSDLGNRCITQPSRPKVKSKSKPQTASDVTESKRLSDKPSHMKNKSSSTSALPRQSSQSNKQTSSTGITSVMQNRKSAIPSLTPTQLARVSKHHTSASVQINKPTRVGMASSKIGVKQQSEHESPLTMSVNKMSKRSISSKVKSAPTIHRNTKEKSPVEQCKRSRSSTPSETSSEVSNTGNNTLPKPNTGKTSTTVKNNVLLKPRHSSVPKPTRASSGTQKRNGNPDKTGEKCKEINRPNVPKSLLGSPKNKRGLDYRHLNARTKIEVTMDSSPESDSSPTLTCCDPIDKCDGSPLEAMTSLPVTPMSPRFVSARSSMGGTPFTTPPEESKYFVLHEKTLLESSKSLITRDGHFVGEDERALFGPGDLLPVTFNNENSVASENDKSSDVDDAYPLTAVNISRCEVSGENVGITRRGSKTLTKVLKSDITDQLPLSEASNIKDPAAGCRQNVDIASNTEYVEQLSIGGKSEISVITSHIATEPVALPLPDGVEGGSDTGTVSSDDYFSISEEDEGDNTSKDINVCGVSVPHVDPVGSLAQVAELDTNVFDGNSARTVTDVTCDEHASLVDNYGIDPFQQSNTGEIIPKQSGPNERALSRFRDAEAKSSNTNDRFILETRNNCTSSIHSADSGGVKSHHSEDNLFANKTPFDLKPENITHHQKSDLDSKPVLINSRELGKNCVPDKNQYVATDYEAVVPVQANLGEYFDDGNDKPEMQINDHKEVALDSSGIKRGGSSDETEGAFTGIMDSISDLSFQNILTNQNNLNGIPTVSNIKPQERYGPSLLTLEHGGSDVQGKDGITSYSDRDVNRTDGCTLESVTDGETTGIFELQPSNSSEGTDLSTLQLVKDGEGINGKRVQPEKIRVSGEHREHDVIRDYTSGEGEHYGVGELNVQWRDERDLTADPNDSRRKVVCDLGGGDGVCDYETESEIIGEISDSESESEEGFCSTQYHSESGEEHGDIAEMNGELGHYNQNNMASRTPQTETAVAMETSNTIYSPRRNLSSRNEATCIRKYEIVTTTITRHKKRETKIIESSSKLSTGAGRLHERRVTDPKKNLVNSRSVKFETSKEIISTSDVDGKVFSTVKNSTNTEILGKLGSSSDAAVSPASSKLAALMQGETITMPECLERSGSIESMNKVKHSIDTLDSGDLQPAVSCGELLTDGGYDNTVSLLQGSDDKKYKSLETKTLSTSVEGGRLLNTGGIRNPPPSPVFTRGQITSVSDGQSPTLSPRLTRGDTKISVIKSRSNTTQTYNLVRRGKQCDNDNTISDISLAIQAGQSGVTTSVTERRQTQTVQSTYQRRPFSPNSSSDTLPSFETGRELSDSGTNADVKSIGLSQVDGTIDTGVDGHYLTNDHAVTSDLSSINNTSENIDSIYGNDTSDTDKGDHRGPESATTTIIDTPKVAVLVTKDFSDSDNEYLSESNDADQAEKKHSREDDKQSIENKNKTSINKEEPEPKVKVSDEIPSVVTDPTVSSEESAELVENSVVFTIPLPTIESDTEDRTSGGNQSGLQPEETMINEVTDITKSQTDRVDASEITQDTTLKLDKVPGEPSMLPTTQTNDAVVSELKNVAKDETSAKSAKAQRRENARQPLRRYTATVCLIERDEEASNVQNMSPPSRPRARSKSPVELKNSGTGPESQQQVSVFGNGRVSEMCRSFIKKASKGKVASLNEEPPSSPLVQSPSPSRKLKWVRDYGVWKKVTPAEYDRIMASRSSAIPEITSSMEDLNQGPGNHTISAREEQESQRTECVQSKHRDDATDESQSIKNKDIHDSIPYIDNTADQILTEEEEITKDVTDTQNLSNSKRNEKTLQEELAVAEETFSFKDNPFKRDECNERRDSLKGTGKDSTRTPPKTLPKPKHRRNRTDSGQQDLLPDKETRTTGVTQDDTCVDVQTTDILCPSTEVVELDRTLTDIDSVQVGIEGREEVDKVSNESMPSLSDKTPEVHVPMKSQDNINDENAVVENDKDRENLSNRYSPSERKSQLHDVQCGASLSMDSRNVSAQSHVNSMTEEDSNDGIRTTTDTENGTCNVSDSRSFEKSTIKLENRVDSNSPTLTDNTLFNSSRTDVKETEMESVKDDSSPELERMSFAQKLKKAQSRSESKLETKDVTRSKRKQLEITHKEDKRGDDSESNVSHDDESCDSPVQPGYKPIVPNYVIGSPQKLRAIRIKQEIFPKEEPEQVKPKAIKKLTAVKISSETFPKEEGITSENGGKFESRDTSPGACDIVEDAGSKTPTNESQVESGLKRVITYDDTYTTRSDLDNSQVDQTRGRTGRQLPKRCINPVKFSYGGINGDYSGDLQPVTRHEADDKSPETPVHALQKELLSEIVELEENTGDDNNANVKNNKNKKERRPCHKSTSSADRYHNNRSPAPSRSFNRSQSLPTGTLSYGGSRIVYKDGHFVIETGYDGTEEIPVLNGSHDNDINVGCDVQNDRTDQQNRVNNNPHRKHLKRISYSDPHLCDDNDGDYDDDSEDVNNDDADVFLRNDGNVTVIDTEDDDQDGDQDGESANVSQQGVQKRNKPDNGSRIPRPLSVDENQLTSMQDTDPNSTMRKIRKSLRDARARRSKSFREMSDQIDGKSKLKRNSSFKEATEKGAVEMKSRSSSTGGEEDGQGLSRSGSVTSMELRPKSPGFLQRLLFKRKSFNEKNLKGEQSTRESFMKKMSLKGLFTGKKEKGDLSPTKANSDEPPTPPIAAFQGDLDIHAVSESAPNSPFSSLKFRRRHTSADLFVQNAGNSANNMNVRRTSDSIPTRRPILQSSRTIDDPGNIKSMLGIENHPRRPISPKPPLMSISRRNSNLSLPSSPLKESPFELTMDNSPNKIDTDSISTCSSLTSSNVDSASLISATSTVCDTDGLKSSVQPSGSGGQDLEKFSALGQGEMTSSNSNDSGIQRDVSVHSSSESIKTNVQDSNSAVVRRRKSPSPRPERPKSEISVRWADLVETTEISPIKRREGSQQSKPRPKSDLGGSSLKSDMKPFGSQTSLLPYNSLQSLDSLRLRHEAMDPKPSKRRMSTPQPIKTRLERTPRKQRTRKTSSTLVRSHSMPESLDKLHRCRKRHGALGCRNLHGDEFHHLDDDSSSDDGSDYSMDRISLHEKSMSVRSSQAQLSTLDEMPEGESLTCAEALWDHITMDPEELGFHAGDVIEVMDMGDKDWWWGAIDEREGWFPATFVRLRVNQEPYEEDLVSQSSEVTQLSPKLRRVSVINKEQARENVVNEIISAEREYVKHLKDVVEGYIKHARKRADMFSEDRISVIFGNIEDIYNFSNRFLESLDCAFTADSPHLSELGHCFLTQSKEFEIYSDYCNNHPSASEELKDLYRKQKYRHFFEACRLLQEMIEIPLEGFLLTPVQKICKYPLQLAELLKYTPPSHPDYRNVEGALEAMKKIAALINERKRKMESIEKLARWQQTVEDWQGPDLLEKSSELITSGEFNKVNSGGWSQERYFFLFDRQLIYCKKDLLKKNGFSYKGRVDLDECELIVLEDGKDIQYNVTVKNAWKLHETIRDKWYLLYTKTQTEKQRWMRAFQKERQRVREDQENNFVPLHWKKTVLNKLRASKEKMQSSQNTVSIHYQKEFLRGIPSHATLPRSYAKKQRDKKKSWSLFGNKKSSK
ncbi:uncharacterized protein LOC110445775 isoform X2 [Mizuhopecten yessoensis]|uniref:uncharacterized protein LOC110445775 isoform X2 n=1 Tax=Mizuhopecten yessoensis TaxID=6573 RepID=UPI000B45D656|nr:uncharacterized protein LOC110445775 isoform X2 [Mizuhopecten yessoensis]